MKLGIILFVIGSALVLYLSNINYKKIFLKRVGIFLGVLVLLYGLILIAQPKDYVKFTETTIVHDK